MSVPLITTALLSLQTFETNDPSTFGIVDLSTYAPNVPDASQLSMQITAPGYPTVNVQFDAGMSNVYRCTDLGINCTLENCCPLPDGIYGILYTVLIGTSPVTIEKTFVRTADIECKWMKAFAKIDLECNCNDYEQKKYKEELKRIDLLINGCKAAGNNCDNDLAFRLYDKANNMISLLSCKFGLPCGTEFKCNHCGGCNS